MNYQAKQNNKVFALTNATQILSEVIRGLEVIHDNDYIHRDIKLENILLKKDPTKFEKYVKNFFIQICKIADFGFTKKLNDADGTILGTGPYMSPEIFSG